jgi:hypothetical protein
VGGVGKDDVVAQAYPGRIVDVGVDVVVRVVCTVLFDKGFEDTTGIERLPFIEVYGYLSAFKINTNNR